MAQGGPKVLVATDFSEMGDEAIRQADRFARLTQSGLLACHIVPYFLRSAPYFTAGLQNEPADVLAIEHEAANRLAERVSALTGRTAEELEIFVDSGAPDAGIVKAAEETRATLVVVGAHGATGIPRLMLGSVAERVVAYAHAPVLVARPSPDSREVLAATDLSIPSLPVVSVGGELARLSGATLTVLHVLDMQSVPGAWIGPASLSAEAWGAARARAEQGLRDAVQQAGVEGVVKVVEGSAAPQIVAEAERLPARFVVVATHGRTALARLAIGSVADQVVRSAPCSVLVLRRP